MNKISVRANFLFALICSLFLCTSSFAEPANLAQLTKEIKAYHDSGAYNTELTDVIARAQKYINDRVAANNKKNKPEKLALILDIDETSLSNYNKMVVRDFVATTEQLHKEVNAADSPAITPTLELYRNALKKDVAIFFVTGRRESERPATGKNLADIGYETYNAIYLKPNDYRLPSIIPFKSQARAAIAAQGYTVIASIGDQNSDLEGGHAEQTFKLPNPFYYLP